MDCQQCGAPDAQEHHVIPESVWRLARPGAPNRVTVWLCGQCHALAPGHPASLIRGQSLSWFARERKRRDKGLQVGGAARFGYAWRDGVVIPDEREQACLARLRALFAAALPHAEIANRLNAEGFTTRRYGQRPVPWTQRSVAGVCGKIGLSRYRPRAA